ncbi:FHA domain-containing protein [Deferrisoma camini]|uniref:FHA domain-containing protein n=1 Tax=Deferrisoma camini TaxID=1035120 RepID=UPI00046CFCDA|nr:FHA domain-containing protein [Deferrisoma camini]
MDRWRVLLGDREVARFDLPEGGAVVLGRGADADVRIDNPAVSRSHCRLVRQGGRVRVEDLGSRNGTFVNGVRVEGSAPVGPEDRVTLAKFTVQAAAESADPGTDLDATVVLGRGPGPGRSAPPRRLVCLSGRAEPEVVDLSGRGVVRVGRGSECEARVGGFALGRVQFTVLASADGHVVAHRGRWRATRVAGRKLGGEPVRLSPGDEIAAGPVRFRYE